MSTPNTPSSNPEKSLLDHLNELGITTWKHIAEVLVLVDEILQTENPSKFDAKTDDRLRHIFANSKNEKHRRAVACNPNCPEQLLWELAKDEDREVRRAVARNPNCPFEILTQFAENDEHSSIREIAVKGIIEIARKKITPEN